MPILTSKKRVYKTLAEFPGYRFGDDGSIWSKRHKNGLPSLTWREMKIPIRGKGYRVATLVNSDKKRKIIAVRCLILKAFVGVRPAKRYQACHNDGNPSNDAIENLDGTPPKVINKTD